MAEKVMASWWNWKTRRSQKAIPDHGVKVRILLGLPLLMLSCAGSRLKPEPTETYLNGCESINVTPTNHEDWSALCYCTETDKEFSDCIGSWTDWNKHQ